MGRGGSDHEALRCGLTTLIPLATILFFSMFDSVEVNHAAIKVYTVSKEIDRENVYLNGRFFLGLARTFHYYPLQLQTIEFSNEEGANGGPVSVWTAGAPLLVLCLQQTPFAALLLTTSLSSAQTARTST